MKLSSSDMFYGDLKLIWIMEDLHWFVISVFLGKSENY